MTEDTPDLVTPSGVASNLDFGDPVEAVNRVAAQLTDGDETNERGRHHRRRVQRGAPRRPVGLSEAKSSRTTYRRILEETSPEVDVIFNGHTHQLYQCGRPQR